MSEDGDFWRKTNSTEDRTIEMRFTRFVNDAKTHIVKTSPFYTQNKAYFMERINDSGKVNHAKSRNWIRNNREATALVKITNSVREAMNE
jgi:hypothetical protein